MIKVYARLVEKGARTLKSIPTSLQVSVKAQLEADGYTINEDGTVTK